MFQNLLCSVRIALPALRLYLSPVDNYIPDLGVVVDGGGWGGYWLMGIGESLIGIAGCVVCPYCIEFVFPYVKTSSLECICPFL